MTTLVCYDISRDDHRARVAAYLQQWGDRIQRSVYVCLFDADELDEVADTITEMVDTGRDAVHILPLCAACWDRMVTIGQAEAEPEQPYWLVL